MSDFNTIKEEELKDIIYITTHKKPLKIERTHKVYNMLFENGTVCSYTIDEIIKLLFKLVKTN